jgi:hypothetical protein
MTNEVGCLIETDMHFTHPSMSASRVLRSARETPKSCGALNPRAHWSIHELEGGLPRKMRDTNFT